MPSLAVTYHDWTVLISLQFYDIRGEHPAKGALAQLGERLICIQEVSGSIPLGSTKFFSDLAT